MRRLGLLGAATLVLGACDGDLLGNGGAEAPENVDAEYRWVLEGWETGGVRPVGHPSVLVSWDLPDDWDGEVFRVYAKRSGDSRYTLAATVTSCSAGRCAYHDRNIAAGESYDYFVTAVDERDERESEESEAVRIDVPVASGPAVPAGITAHALDNGVFLRWTGADDAQRYVVYLQDGDDLVTVGETDGTGFLDRRAENGSVYRYRVAAVDEDGHYGDLSGAVAGIPRPDFRAEVVYALGDSARLSGFRFRARETDDPLVDGNGGTAQWRLEISGGVPRIVPLGQTRVTAGVFTSELGCGPGSDAECVDVSRAPTTGFQSTSVAADPGFTYVFRVVGDDNLTHYGKIRVVGSGRVNGRNVLIFDWAYQTRPDETSLRRAPRL